MCYHGAPTSALILNVFLFFHAKLLCVGMCTPRNLRYPSSLHIRIVELLQDVVSVLLLPLYFAVSGLKTDITLLDNGVSWALTAITILAACAGKWRKT